MMRPKGENNFVFKNGHVAYQTKGNGTYGNIQANSLHFHTPSTHRVGFKGQNIFSSERVHVAYQNCHTCSMVIYTMVGLGRSGVGVGDFL